MLQMFQLFPIYIAHQKTSEKHILAQGTAGLQWAHNACARRCPRFRGLGPRCDWASPEKVARASPNIEQENAYVCDALAGL